MMVLWAENVAYTAARFSPYYKENKKYNNLLSDFLESFVVDKLFNHSMYTVIES